MAALYASGNKRYRALVNRSFSRMPQNNSFVSRGGIWVLAQVPVMLLAFAIPVWQGRGHLTPDGLVPMGGVAVTLLGVLLAVWGFASLGKALTPFPKPLADATLCRHGAYRFMRHPMYTSVMLVSLGWALWWLCEVGVLYVLGLAFFFDRKAVHEEIWLREKYKDYADYARRVKKFIPGLY
ncbi:MAG TPA: isoprenylcysteine carboxylmethyltransferase family protein [Sulfuricaulis sp.]|nr:isoprenylcysteine carboxylmethyltransferase family protein [Sulfuricaulis sp.]